MTSWSETLHKEWQHRYYSSSSLSDTQKFQERRQHEAEFVMQMDGIIGEKLFRVFSTKEEAYKYIMDTPPLSRCFYETIFDTHLQKPKFDIDIKLSKIPSDFLENFHNIIIEVILAAIQRNIPWMNPSEDIALYQSHGKDKYSYHIVIHGYYLLDNNEASTFVRQVIKTLRDDKISDSRLIDLICECIDLNVYKNLQQFRLLYCSKRGKERYKTRITKFLIAGIEIEQKVGTDEEEFYKSLITFIEPTMKRLLLTIYQQKDEIPDPVTVKPKKASQSLWWMNAEDVYQHLLDKHLASQFAENSRYDFHNTLITIRIPNTGYFCETCSRRHNQENPFIFLRMNRQTGAVDIMFDCRRSDDKTSHLCSMIRIGDKIMFACTE